jgi:undecaprenyl phosphate N,N'-diacetylbacillosamine 1-phosphate transferase
VYKSFIKRALDIAGALFLMLLLSPIMIIIVAVLFFYNRGKVFFKQSRPGKNGKAFLLYKFKTMREANGKTVSDTERVTPLGNFLRKSSIDELPQLINVLKGEMSFVGPRPLLMEYLPLYSEEQKKRHFVKPGITGWAQVNGRNSISWSEKFSLDVYYAENYSFGLDFKIFLRTFFIMLSGKGVNDKRKEIAEKFKGNKS